jgi:hypothetical protein
MENAQRGTSRAGIPLRRRSAQPENPGGKPENKKPTETKYLK